MEPARKLRNPEQPTTRPVRPELRLVEPERRTVRITGQATAPRRRRPATQRPIAARPDRIALWAFLLGLFLVFMAAVTAHAAVL